MVAGPLFVSLVALNIWASSDWLHSLGWELSNPGIPFPSSLALGPHGWIQIGNYLLTGGLLLVFALGFRRHLKGRLGWVAGGLTIAFALTVLLTALRIDHSMLASDDPQTWTGWAHAFGALVGLLTAMLAMAFVGLALRLDASWQTVARISLLGPLLVIGAGFTPPGLAGSLLVVLAWYLLLGTRLHRAAAQPVGAPIRDAQF